VNRATNGGKQDGPIKGVGQGSGTLASTGVRPQASTPINCLPRELPRGGFNTQLAPRAQIRRI